MLGTLRPRRLDRLIDARPSPERDRGLAMRVARVLEPGSQRATARGLAEATATDSPADPLGLGTVDEDDRSAARDWLLKRQDRIEWTLAKRYLAEGALVLHDLTSGSLAGRLGPLARRGDSRDGQRGQRQIEFGLLCDAGGRPVAGDYQLIPTQGGEQVH